MEKYKKEFRQLSLNISHYRKKRGLSQQDLAELIGISHNHLAQIEAPNITRPFSIKILFSVAKTLEVKPETLFRFDD
jgi:transcriptional regulator with XRE-family HTH domain